MPRYQAEVCQQGKDSYALSKSSKVWGEDGSKHLQVWWDLKSLSDLRYMVLQSSCSWRKRVFFQDRDRTLRRSPPCRRNWRSGSPSKPLEREKLDTSPNFMDSFYLRQQRSHEMWCNLTPVDPSAPARAAYLAASRSFGSLSGSWHVGITPETCWAQIVSAHTPSPRLRAWSLPRVHFTSAPTSPFNVSKEVGVNTFPFFINKK